MRTKLFLTAIVVSILTAGCNTPVEEDKQQIQSLIGAYETALNENRANDIVELYAQKPTFMPQHAPAQLGKDAVSMAYQNVFKAIDLDIKFEVHEIEVFGDTAWARTSSAGRTKLLSSGAEVTEGNNELFIFKKETGQWKIYQYLFATNQPRS